LNLFSSITILGHNIPVLLLPFDVILVGTSSALMETESKENETDKKAPRLRRRAGLKFAPKASSNSAPKIIPKTEQHEESKVAAIDKELMLKLRTPKALMCLVFYLLDLAVYNF